MIDRIPEAVQHVLTVLENHGHQAYLVGGCVRDHLLGRAPKDYDIATDAHPTRVQNVFNKVIPTGIDYGTVTVLEGGTPVEVTTFRADGNYGDGRRPDTVTFGTRIEDDLARRDFTMNAMAWMPGRNLVDPFNGSSHLKQKVVHTVGKPADRFKEDALRMLRAVRFATILHFDLSDEVAASIRWHAFLLKNVSLERVRDEFSTMLGNDSPARGLRLLHRVNLLRQFLPELEACHGFKQHNPGHVYDVFDHTVNAVNAIPPALHLRLAALLHDIGKPPTFSLGEDAVGHFYTHEEVGADMAGDILRRLKYDNDTIRRVTVLVRAHMFPSEMGTKAVRRLIVRVGAENMEDLLALRQADIDGSGVPHDVTHMERVRQVMEEMRAAGTDRLAVTLAVNGHDVMRELGTGPGPVVGRVLATLREHVLDDPALNQRDVLLSLIKQTPPSSGGAASG